MTPLPITPIGLGASSGVLGTAATAPTAATVPGANIAAPTGPGGVSFQGMLADKLSSVSDLQVQANAASQAVASGSSSDLAGATVAVEKASIAMELTSAIRNKAVEAYQDIMRMQV
jgi:flagellar hook-basal body complex protein FliE